jgi:hypothetical protein
MRDQEYQGFVLRVDSLPRTGARNEARVSVGTGNEEVFAISMSVTDSYSGQTQVDGAALARDLALRWAHGLIDLDRYTSGQEYLERRDTYWRVDVSSIDDEALRAQILSALLRMKRAEPLMTTIPWLDVDGFADVLGVDRNRVRSQLSELAGEGLVTGRAEAFGATLTEGRCEITAEGIRELRSSTRSRPSSESSALQDDDEGPTRVFISYSHDSEAHKCRVRELADRLRDEGVDCDIDQYPGSGRTGWPEWMRDRIAWADFVIVACTEEYLAKAISASKSGARWESLIITQELYEAGGHNEKYMPVIFSNQDEAYIPPWLQPYTRYDVSIDGRYDDMYRVLTDQPAVSRPPLGPIRVLDPLEASESDDELGPGAEHWTAGVTVLWTAEGGNTRHVLTWSPGAGFTAEPEEPGTLQGRTPPIQAISVTYSAGRVLRFDLVPPLRLVDAFLQRPDGTRMAPESTGGGLPLDEWFAEFKNPP